MLKVLSSLFIVMLFLSGCNSKADGAGDDRSHHKRVLKDYLFTCDLKDNMETLRKYKRYHSKEGVWPEVTTASEASGAERIRIFLQDTRLVLIITLPQELSFDDFNERYNGHSGKMSEWESIMSDFQIPPPGAKEGQTWVAMDEIYNFTEGESSEW